MLSTQLRLSASVFVIRARSQKRKIHRRRTVKARGTRRDTAPPPMSTASLLDILWPGARSHMAWAASAEHGAEVVEVVLVVRLHAYILMFRNLARLCGLALELLCPPSRTRPSARDPPTSRGTGRKARIAAVSRSRSGACTRAACSGGWVPPSRLRAHSAAMAEPRRREAASLGMVDAARTWALKARSWTTLRASGAKLRTGTISHWSSRQEAEPSSAMSPSLERRCPRGDLIRLRLNRSKSSVRKAPGPANRSQEHRLTAVDTQP